VAVKVGFGIDIGEDSIKLVELRKGKTGIHISRVEILKTGITPSLTRAQRESIIEDKLGEILQGVNVGKSPLTVATPGLSAFIRYVKLPPVTSSRLQQIIGYEAQQQVPFPLEEVIWDYQVLESSSKSETDVILVAIKAEVISNLMNVMGLQGLEPSAIEHRPLALYNCFRLNEKSEGGVKVIIDIGARATDLSIERKGELCWTRSIRIGGGDITEGIQKTFNISFEDAEKLKKDKGIICLNEDEEKSAGEEGKRFWQAMKPVVEEMVMELQRSASYFHSQLEGGRINKIFLTGGCSRLRNFDLFIRDHLGTELERLNPLKNITCSPELLQGEDVESGLGVAIGLALRSINESFSTIDLLPKVVAGRRELQKKRVYLLLSGLSMVFMLGVSTVFSIQNYTVMELQVWNISTELREYKKYDKEIQKLKTEQNKIQGRINMLKDSVIARDYWPNILLEFSRILPHNTLLKSISAVGQDKGLVELKGRTSNFDAVTNLISCLEQSPLFHSVEVISAVPVEEVVKRTREERGRRGRREEVGMEKDIPATEVRKTGIDFVLRVELIK
jgi:type IV pilus assembly protein PilM